MLCSLLILFLFSASILCFLDASIPSYNSSLFQPSLTQFPLYNSSYILNFCSNNVHDCQYQLLALPSDRFFSFFWTLFPYHRIGPEQNFPLEYYSTINQNNDYFTDLCSFWEQFWKEQYQTSKASSPKSYYEQVYNTSCIEYYNSFIENSTVLQQIQKSFANESSTINLVHQTKQYFCSYCEFQAMEEFNLLFPRNNNSLLLSNQQQFGSERFCFPDIPRWIMKSQNFPSQICYCSKYNKFIDSLYPCSDLEQIFYLEFWFLLFNLIRLPVSLFNLFIAICIITIPSICKIFYNCKWSKIFSLKLLSIYFFSVTCTSDALQNITLICEYIFPNFPIINSLSQVLFLHSRLLLWFTLILLLSLWHTMATHYKDNSNFDTSTSKDNKTTNAKLKSRSSTVFNFVEEAYSSPLTARSKQLHHLKEDYYSTPMIKSTSLQQMFKTAQYKKTVMNNTGVCEVMKKLIVCIAFLYIFILQVGGMILELLVYFVSGGRLLDHIYEAYNLCLNILLSISYLLVVFSYPLFGVLILKWLRSMGLWNWYYRFFIFLISITPTYVVYWLLHLLTTLNAFNEDPVTTFIFKVAEYILYKIQIWLLLLLLMSGANSCSWCCCFGKILKPSKSSDNVSSENTQRLAFSQDFMNSFDEHNAVLEKKPLLVSRR